jgi:CRISPR-associated protein Cmr4
MTTNTPEGVEQGRSTGPRHAPMLYLVRGISPVHVGVGEGMGAINLPTARESLTGYPLVPGSSVKGVLRDFAEYRYGRESEEVWTAFGPDQTRAADARGGLVITDANLLALPVRSLYGTFAWVTCPFILRRLVADAREAGQQGAGIEALARLCRDGDQVPRVAKEGCRLVAKVGGGRLLLEDRPVGTAEGSEDVSTAGAWISRGFWPYDEDMQAFFLARFLVLPDDLLGFFSRMSLEVRQRVKIDSERGTAAASGPWSEEYMPAETLLHGLVLGRTTVYVPERGTDDTPKPNRPKDATDGLGVLRGLLEDTPMLRLGGKSSGGSGRVHMRLLAPASGGSGT